MAVAGDDRLTWQQLPTTDQGHGICEWCGHAITADWPAIIPQHEEDLPVHFHMCSILPTEGFPHGRPA